MAISPATIAERLSNMFLGNSSEGPKGTGGAYDPSPIDIFVVRTILCRSKRLPPDIVDVIFDHAGYWAHSTNQIDYMEEHKNPLRITGTGKKENKFLLRSIPVGLTTIDDRKNLAEELAYDTNESIPRPLKTELDPSLFKSLAKYPTPELTHPVRKVVFTVKSRDQGWGGDRNRGDKQYAGSWTWFEAGLERFDREQTCEPHCTSDLRYNSPKSPEPSLPLCGLRPVQPTIQQPSGEDVSKYEYNHPLLSHDKYTIQRNKTANRQWQYNVVTWSWDDNVDPASEEAKKLDENEGRGKASATGEFVRSLKLGDVVTIWGKARFPGWTNQVEKVKIDIYWAV